MRSVEIWSEELPHSFWWKPDNYLGGTPEFVVETAESLTRQGFEVTVYYDNETTEHNGIYYLPRNQYRGEDIVIACNSKPPFLGKRNIAWTNWVHTREIDYAEFDHRVVLSKYHQSIFGHNSVIIPHACWPEQFTNPVKEEKLCLYSSSPDRGLDFLQSIWPEVEQRTGAKLVSTYSKKIPEPVMIDLYKKAQFWLHPGQGVELFCISAYKAQAAGCIPVVVPNMALAETVRYGVKTTLEQYKEDLINAIETPPGVPAVTLLDWNEVTKLFVDLC